jgi:hypothetical protein
MHRLFAEGILEMPDVFSIQTGHHPERSEGPGLLAVEHCSMSIP